MTDVDLTLYAALAVLGCIYLVVLIVHELRRDRPQPRDARGRFARRP